MAAQSAGSRGTYRLAREFAASQDGELRAADALAWMTARGWDPSACERPLSAVQQALARLCRLGELARTGTGTYRTVPPDDREAPWPITNAIACLREVRDREQDGSERAETVRLSVDYAIEVVRSINNLRPPQPPDPAQEAAKAVRAFCRDVWRGVPLAGRWLRPDR